MDAREGIQQKMDEIMPKGDDGSNNTYMDPSDPTKVRRAAVLCDVCSTDLSRKRREDGQVMKHSSVLLPQYSWRL